VPIRSQIVRLPVAGLAVSAVALLLTAAAHAADPEAFLAGTSRNCVECDFAGRDFKERDFKRAKLDRASFKNADLAGASLFRASLVRADFSGAARRGQLNWSTPNGRIFRRRPQRGCCSRPISAAPILRAQI
jgi:hypothetical protein